MLNLKPLRERVKILKEEDWDIIEHVARAMYMSVDDLPLYQAEAYAMLGEIERIENGDVRRLN